MNLKKIFNVGYQGFADGSASFFNSRISELTGYTMEEFNSKRVNWVNELMEPDDVAEAREALITGLKGDRTYSRSYRIRTKQGEEKWILELAQIILSDAGKLDYVTGALIDITEEKAEEFARERISRLSGKYLLVSVRDQQYGIPILNVKEIIRMLTLTPVFNQPVHVKGVVNLRGKIIPVVDLCLKFGFEARQYTDRNCIVILETNGGTHNANMGVVVDEVSEAVYVDGADIEDTPHYTRKNSKYILGMAKIDDHVKVLLNMDKIFSPDDLAMAQG